MDDDTSILLAVNSGSSSIKFATFTNQHKPRRLLWGEVERMASTEAGLSVAEPGGVKQNVSADVSDHSKAADAILHLLEERFGSTKLVAIGHRIVHGGPHYSEPQAIDASVLDELKRLKEFVPNHLPAEITMIEAFERHAPGLPQIACFDTAFHHELPEVARTLPIPFKYYEGGIRKYGFHGLSYAYLMEELDRLAGSQTAPGRIILAHLGSGASLAAVKNGRCIDTTMGFTPTGGLVMGTRSDLDPGLIAYLIRSENRSADDLENLLNRESGMAGISGMGGDMRDLLARETADPRASLAVSIFCYQIRKWMGSFAAAMGGVDVIVFSAGIGEHVPIVRKRICEDLKFLGVILDDDRNTANAAIISSDAATVSIRVIPTDEEIMIARAVQRALPISAVTRAGLR